MFNCGVTDFSRVFVLLVELWAASSASLSALRGRRGCRLEAAGSCHRGSCGWAASVETCSRHCELCVWSHLTKPDEPSLEQKLKCIYSVGGFYAKQWSHLNLHSHVNYVLYVTTGTDWRESKHVLKVNLCSHHNCKCLCSLTPLGLSSFVLLRTKVLNPVQRT